ncbi:helix-turn-helix transcriptional regulator [Edaphobacillus lindanitolerans]|uniref:DNA-binding transcriptional regulator, XRE-family HTH domain n=1 Tax=Edaphobacillus lindanitolerans TaxID=550447 RepID=A0A1U7PT63_9BACI|nr:helix-turn-helix transcriptional regulator [Edaphobacillus lindanitolerans]SIT91494.1 DNA-binding transcriptional regulator, XRE-family HTH domain [Edaphobacillus lindanitolerans]
MRLWLKEKREKKNLTQEQVALKVGIARTTYAMYEQGRRTPDVGVAVKIGDLLKFKWILFFEKEVHEARKRKGVS